MDYFNDEQATVTEFVTHQRVLPAYLQNQWESYAVQKKDEPFFNKYLRHFIESRNRSLITDKHIVSSFERSKNQCVDRVFLNVLYLKE